jgi:hypothetical protein
VEVNDMLRPLGRDGEVASENLFVAGSLLAYQDWMRMKCGAGLAISTACRVGQSFIHCSAQDAVPICIDFPLDYFAGLSENATKSGAAQDYCAHFEHRAEFYTVNNCHRRLYFPS